MPLPSPSPLRRNDSIAALLSPAEWDLVATSLRLTPRQKQIVELILLAKKDKEITAELKMNASTLRTQITRIFARTDSVDRVFQLLCRRLRKSVA